MRKGRGSLRTHWSDFFLSEEGGFVRGVWGEDREKKRKRGGEAM